VFFEEQLMSESLYALAVLACPVGMGAMMWMMMRGQHRTAEPDTAAQQTELAALRAQIDQLEAERRDAQRAGSNGEGPR
jgi:flagellar basal body-associated protein FliL